MKKWISIILVTLGFLLLVGCESEKEKIAGAKASFKGKINEISRMIRDDPTLSKYISKVDYKWSKQDKDEDETEKNNLKFDLKGNLDDSFDKLSTLEQYDFFVHFHKVIDEAKIKDEEGFKYEAYLLDANYLSFKTNTKKYSTFYDEGEDIGLFFAGDEIIHDWDIEDMKKGLVKTNPNVSPPVVATGEQTTPAGQDTNATTANGTDWEKMSALQKEEAVFSVLSALKNINYKILEGPEWFVEALNSLYGDSATNGLTVVEAVSITGVGGGVIIQP